MKRKISNVAASVHARLLNKAAKEERPFNEYLQNYAMERFLYRLSSSRHAERFVLKGALALRKYGGPVTRATKDIDLYSHRTATIEKLVEIFRDCLTVKVQDDGIGFDPSTVTGEEIRIDSEYNGVRLRFRGHLGNARLSLQVDVGFGDAIIPGPVEFIYPTLLDSDNPHLLAYTAETIVAEKLEAMIALDLANTRLKDFLDLWTLAQGVDFSGTVLAQAIRATLKRRNTPIDDPTPVALTSSFYDDPARRAQWRSFLRKANVSGAPEELSDVAIHLQAFVGPLLQALRTDAPFERTWPRGGPWSTPTPSA